LTENGKGNFIRDSFFFTKYRVWDRKSQSVYKELIKNQTLPPDELLELNWEKRKNIVTFAYKNVPFYRKYYKESGFHPEDLKYPVVFSQVPTLKREHIRNFNSDLICNNSDSKNMKCSTTGGTTGMPVKVYLDRRVSHAPLGWRMLNWWGLSPSDHIGIIWRRVDPAFRQFIDKLIWWPTKQLILNASEMTHQNLNSFVTKFNRIKPPILHGYVGAIHHLANFIEEQNMFMNPPQAVWVTCSPLSKAHRKYLEKVYRAPVYDQYGSCEIYWLSSQCSVRKGHHIFYDCRHIEFADDQGKTVPDGKVGNILVTDLENRVFPIIRYEIGDLGRAMTKRCECGVTLPLMDAVQGKSVDLVKFPDGTCISDMNVIFDDFPELVKGFQVIQKSDYSIQINYIPDAESDKLQHAFKIIEKRIMKQSGDQAEISFNVVRNIPHQLGKLKYIISEIDQN